MKQMKGQVMSFYYRGAYVTGVVVNQNGGTLLVQVTKTSDASIVRPRQCVIYVAEPVHSWPNNRQH